MSIALRITEKILGAEDVAVPNLRLPASRLAAREILRRRVAAEVARYNAGVATGSLLIPASAPKRMLNGPRPAPHPGRLLAVEPQLALAAAAIEKGRVLMLLDGRQVVDLDEEFDLTDASEARFVQLVPLVGG
jgi:hypothetical protein